MEAGRLGGGLGDKGWEKNSLGGKLTSLYSAANILNIYKLYRYAGKFRVENALLKPQVLVYVYIVVVGSEKTILIYKHDEPII